MPGKYVLILLLGHNLKFSLFYLKKLDLIFSVYRIEQYIYLHILQYFWLFFTDENVGDVLILIAINTVRCGWYKSLKFTITFRLSGGNTDSYLCRLYLWFTSQAKNMVNMFQWSNKLFSYNICLFHKVRKYNQNRSPLTIALYWPSRYTSESADRYGSFINLKFSPHCYSQANATLHWLVLLYYLIISI